jgi:hypothetical protein
MAGRLTLQGAWVIATQGDVRQSAGLFSADAHQLMALAGQGWCQMQVLARKILVDQQDTG